MSTVTRATQNRVACRASAFALCLAAVATGCSGGGDRGNRAGAAPPTTTTIAAMAVPDLPPVDLVYQSTEFAELADKAKAAQIAALALCLHEQGFTIKADALFAAIRGPLVHEIGEPNMEQRRQYGWGYSIPTPPEFFDHDAVNTAGESASDVALGDEDDTFSVDQGLGTPLVGRMGGCSGEAHRRVYGSVTNWDLAFNLPIRAHNEAASLMPQDQRPNVERDWLQCMHARGYTYDNQSGPRETLKRLYAEHGTTPQLQARERREAVDDGECTHEARLPEIRRAAAEQYLAQLTPDARQDLETAARILVELQPRAEAILREAEETFTPTPDPSTTRNGKT